MGKLISLTEFREKRRAVISSEQYDHILKEIREKSLIAQLREQLPTQFDHPYYLEPKEPLTRIDNLLRKDYLSALQFIIDGTEEQRILHCICHQDFTKKDYYGGITVFLNDEQLREAKLYNKINELLTNSSVKINFNGTEMYIPISSFFPYNNKITR